MATTQHLVRRSLLAAGAAGCLAVGLVAQLPAYAAAPGAGTWTRITTPSAERSILSEWGHEGRLTVAGRASADVTVVNVYCLRGVGTTVDATTVATSVPVSSSGSFSTRVPVPGSVLSPQCRLRALPSGVNPQTYYLASYAGPVMNFDSWRYLPSQDTVQLRASSGDGTMVAAGIGICNASLLGSLAPDDVMTGGSDGCLYALRAPSPGAGHSSVRVDGHEAYTTGAALSYGLTPSRLASRSFHLLRSGGVRWTEVMPVDRCASDAAFPPSAGSCPTVVSSGISIRQVSTYLPGGHQVRMRSTIRSVDGRRHTLRLAYENTVYGVTDGSAGYRFPGRQGFHASSPGRAVSKLGTASGTLLVRNDRFASPDDPAVATRAMTWSRTPSSIRFAPTAPDTFAMSYRLTVPKDGTTQLGFTDSDAGPTGRAVALGAKAEADMMPAPSITSPAKGAVIQGRATTVRCVVRSGANGLPTSVTVNGHVAKVKPNKSASRATFTVTFGESIGRHTLRAVATDAGGNRRSTSVKVTNK
jgi:hypothetical protein